MYVFIELFNFSFFSITGQGIDLDYHDIEWFALEINRDHSVIFEIASKYCLFNLYAEYIMRNAGLDEAQAGIKLPGEISITSDMHNHPYGRKWRGTKKPLDEVKEESEKVGLKLNIQKTKIMASGPIASWEIDGETVSDLFLGAPKSLQMVIAAMKWKEAYSLEGKLWPT